jgi:hypothetical protein
LEFVSFAVSSKRNEVAGFRKTNARLISMWN